MEILYCKLYFKSLNMKILFTSPTVFQKRNFHNLLNDFEDEVPVYRDTEKIIEILETLKLYKSKKKIVKKHLFVMKS